MQQPVVAIKDQGERQSAADIAQAARQLDALEPGQRDLETDRGDGHELAHRADVVGGQAQDLPALAAMLAVEAVEMLRASGFVAFT